jgi:hypothetical protein
MARLLLVYIVTDARKAFLYRSTEAVEGRPRRRRTQVINAHETDVARHEG